MTSIRIFGYTLVLSMMAWLVTSATGADTEKPHPISIGSELKMTVPAAWQPRTPRVRMIEHEFAIPAAEGDKEDGRMTVMTAGGSVDANVQRWLGQFTQTGGTETGSKGKVEKKKIADREVTIVDVSGTYRDMRGPMAPAVERSGYRMLAAVIPTSQANYFVKFYGPKKTVQQNAEAFQRMLASLSTP